MFLDRVCRQDDAGCGLRNAAGYHGAPFPERCVAAGPVERSKAPKFGRPILGMLFNDRAARAAERGEGKRVGVNVVFAELGGGDFAASRTRLRETAQRLRLERVHNFAGCPAS